MIEIGRARGGRPARCLPWARPFIANWPPCRLRIHPHRPATITSNMDQPALLAKLQALSIETENHAHGPVMTCEAQVCRDALWARDEGTQQLRERPHAVGSSLECSLAPLAPCRPQRWLAWMASSPRTCFSRQVGPASFLAAAAAARCRCPSRRCRPPAHAVLASSAAARAAGQEGAAVHCDGGGGHNGGPQE